jgi:hypothetical protein
MGTRHHRSLGSTQTSILLLMRTAQAALGPGGTEAGFRQAASATLAALRGSADTMTV